MHACNSSNGSSPAIGYAAGSPYNARAHHHHQGQQGSPFLGAGGSTTGSTQSHPSQPTQVWPPMPLSLQLTFSQMTVWSRTRRYERLSFFLCNSLRSIWGLRQWRGQPQPLRKPFKTREWLGGTKRTVSPPRLCVMDWFFTIKKQEKKANGHTWNPPSRTR